ncbi:MAG: NUDIX hydrolase [Pseudanabaenaceae cyanobacterium bins.68]|nr:NUDIX hydrolase [Pseudanabaenaceae cyanobacterium bins.68]
MWVKRSRYWLEQVVEVIFRHPITAVSLLAINPQGQLILTQRADSRLWGLPGGMVKWGEHISATAARELQEETGLTITQIKRLVGVYSDPGRDPRIHSICIALEVLVTGEIKVQDDQEILQAIAYEFGQLPQSQLAHDHARQLADYFKLCQGEPPAIA